MITFSKGNVQTVRDNEALTRQHWNEIVKDGRKLEIDWDLFEALQNSGSLRVYVAQEDDEVLGYAAFVLQRHLHSKSCLVANNDAVFLRKDRRAYGAGLQFLAYCDEQLRQEGVSMIFWHIKPARDFSGTLEQLGYELHETIYAKFIGG